MGAWIVFAVIAALMLVSAVMVVWSKDLVHTVLWLAAGLITTAAIYVALHADFLAAAQILLYTGGVITLMLFAVMLTKRLTGPNIAVLRGQGGPMAAVVSLMVFGLVATAVGRSMKPRELPELEVDSQALGELFLTDLMLPFELLSVLLLAAMVGAIVLARREGGRPPLPTIQRKLPPRGES